MVYTTGKDRYCLEVPLSRTSKVPAAWSSISATKTLRRYTTAYTTQTVTQLSAAEDSVRLAQTDLLRQLFRQFDQDRSLWTEVSTCLAILDVLCALSEVCQRPDTVWPAFLPCHDSSSEHTATSDQEKPAGSVQNEALHLISMCCAHFC